MTIEIDLAGVGEADQLLRLQKRAFRKEAERNGDLQIAPMVETLPDLEAAFGSHTALIARDKDAIVGAVRLRVQDGVCHIGRLFVAPEYQGRGIGRKLFQAAEAEGGSAGSFRLVTGKLSTANIRLYESLGYKITGESMENGRTPLVVMEKQKSGPQRPL
ncbi:GNAT family N-acetyltransferase [Roseibium denhamense]|uniref:Acetyltransferase (GNAT) domain-containing protein n=1 Tax=Roseibium denhamense TaxID=76305 RepID=A0ABY1P5I0_9HYPH|nr:GNAT family N-acetyltransferase [Roseibium denhamense]MTI07773.1 GNAT family N-acetyltransferase [Roseibium denhamense]SMP25321.1 Acetyltransferase (GNAT) domain-containing protein [Roseibium denhamense]